MHRVAIAFGAFVAIGCVGSGAGRPGPEQTVSELASALRSGDVPTVARITGRAEADVTASQETNGRELHALGETLLGAPVESSSRVSVGDGGAIVLVREGESWRVDRGVLGRPSLSRPEDAVIALHDALARSRIAAVLSLVARAPRADVESELARWLDGTADPDALEISVHGESATVTTPTGEHLELVRESGEWRVLEID